MKPKKYSNDPLVRQAQEYGGFLEKRATKRRGASYVFRWSLDGKMSSKSFKAGTAPRAIQAFMTHRQRQIFFYKNGTLPEGKLDAVALNFQEVWDWYEKNVLGQFTAGVGYRLRHVAKKLEEYLRGRRMHKNDVNTFNAKLMTGFYEWLRKTEGYSEPTAYHTLIGLRKIFRDAANEGIMGTFPFPK